MKESLRVCLAQLNFTVGDIKGNTEKIIKSIKEAQEKEADVICFPELSVTGYPPEDLLHRSKFVEDNREALEEIVKNTGEIVSIVGFVDGIEDDIYNAAAVINDGKIAAIYHKNCLPNYGVFDEERYFKKGKEVVLINIKNVSIGLTICEDIWDEKGPVEELSRKGARLLININASPYQKGKIVDREKLLTEKAKDNKSVIIYNNLIGGQDEIIFDGNGLIVDEKGDIVASLSQFKQELAFFDIDITNLISKNTSDFILPVKKEVNYPLKKYSLLKDEEEVYEALKLGLKDYIHKNNFEKVVIGLSGGIDSALTTAIAVDALGAKKVTAVLMPSRFTSNESNNGAQELAKHFDMPLLNLPIDGLMGSYKNSLKDVFKNTDENETEQNIQARIRGNLLMALSNKYGYIVLATGNKSELSVGYATLYGDMAGGFSVLKDVYKTLVYKLCKYRNSISEVIPAVIITRPPSAELADNQLDTDALPPYEILDPILKSYIEENKSPAEIIKDGFEKETVLKVVKMVDANEYKRRQAAPGIKITPKAFGRDRRMPITNGYIS